MFSADFILQNSKLLAWFINLKWPKFAQEKFIWILRDQMCSTKPVFHQYNCFGTGLWNILQKKIQITHTNVSMIRDFIFSWRLSFTDHSVFPVLHSLITKNKVSRTLDLHCELTSASINSLWQKQTDNTPLIYNTLNNHRFYKKWSESINFIPKSVILSHKPLNIQMYQPMLTFNHLKLSHLWEWLPL